MTALYLFLAVPRVWHESRPVGGLAEELVAMLIVDGATLGCFIGGIWGGIAAYRWSNKNVWIGWLVGLALFGAIGSLRYFAESIPGVGWRVEMMNNAEPVEY